jgi:hypothetical protein
MPSSGIKSSSYRTGDSYISATALLMLILWAGTVTWRVPLQRRSISNVAGDRASQPWGSFWRDRHWRRITWLDVSGPSPPLDGYMGALEYLLNKDIIEQFVPHRRHAYGPPRSVTGIALLSCMQMLFVHHRRHTYGPLRPVTWIALLYLYFFIHQIIDLLWLFWLTCDVASRIGFGCLCVCLFEGRDFVIQVRCCINSV